MPGRAAGATSGAGSASWRGGRPTTLPAPGTRFAGSGARARAREPRLTVIYGARRRARVMDWEMAAAIATMFGMAGWFVFKVLAWRRKEAARREKAREDEAAKSAKAREDEAAKSDAAFKAIDVRLGALERGQAAIMAELGGIKGTMGRFFRTQEADRKEANERREADRAMMVEIKAEMAGFKSSLDNLYRLHREGMEVHSSQIAALGARMDRLEGRMDRLEVKVDRLERDVAALKAEFAEFREAVMPRARPAGAAS